MGQKWKKQKILKTIYHLLSTLTNNSNLIIKKIIYLFFKIIKFKLFALKI